MPIIETCCLGYVLDLIGFDARALDTCSVRTALNTIYIVLDFVPNIAYFVPFQCRK